MNANSLVGAARLAVQFAKSAAPNDKLVAKALAQTEKELTKLAKSAKGWTAKEKATLTDPTRLEVMRATIFHRCLTALRRSATQDLKHAREQAFDQRREAQRAALEARRAMKAPPGTKTTKPK